MEEYSRLKRHSAFGGVPTLNSRRKKSHPGLPKRSQLFINSFRIIFINQPLKTSLIPLCTPNSRYLLLSGQRQRTTRSVKRVTGVFIVQQLQSCNQPS